MRYFVFIVLSIVSVVLYSKNAKQQNNDNNMADEEQILQTYKDMYSLMVKKDTAKLRTLMTEDFVLIHMTGMKQDRESYLQYIADGTLNYYSATHENLEVRINNDTATLIGQSQVTASVFGSRKNTWHLQLYFTFIKRNGKWLQTSSRASTY